MITAISVALCIVCSAGSKFDQIYLEKLRDTVQLKGAMHFAVNSRLECAVVCGNKSYHDQSLLYVERGRCQCLTDVETASLEKGTFELWKIQSTLDLAKDNHSREPPGGFPQGEDKGLFVICNGKELYWYDKATYRFLTQQRLSSPGSVVVDIGYIRSTETLYWVTNRLEGLHSALLSFGKIGPEKRTMFKGFKIDHFELDIERDEVIWMTVQTIQRCSLSMTEDEEGEDEFDPLLQRRYLGFMTIDRSSKHIYFGDTSSIEMMDYDGNKITEIRRGSLGLLFYNEADKTLYWKERDVKKGTYSIKRRKQHPPGEIHTIREFENDITFLHVHKTTIFHKTKKGWCISLMTVEAAALQPCIGTSLLNRDISLEFL